MWEEWQMVLMLGVAPFERMNWMADVPTCITSALISYGEEVDKLMIKS